MIKNCTSNSEDGRTLNCPIPAINSDLRDELDNGTLSLNYSLIAASVPELSDLHIFNALQFTFVEDPMIYNFTDVLNYRAGSNMAITISVSVLCMRACEYYVSIGTLYTCVLLRENQPFLQNIYANAMKCNE